MVIGLSIIITTFLYLMIVLIVYFSKPRIKSVENKIYSYIIIVTFLIFYYTDHINRRRTRKYAGYKNPVQNENENNQLDIV